MINKKIPILAAAILSVGSLASCGGGASSTSTPTSSETAVVKKIEASLNQSEAYLVGEKISKSVITVNATYSNGNVKAVNDWTCPDLSNDYTVTEADGAARNKEFTITFSGATTKLKVYTFDGKVSVEEYNQCLNYLQTGNNGTKVQNYRVSIYGDEIIKSKLISIEEFEANKSFANYYDIEESTYNLYENNCNFGIEKNESDQKYYVSHIDDDLPSVNTLEDFDNLNISAQEDPRIFDSVTRSYSYDDQEYGTVKSKFEYVNGEIRLKHFSYLFESSEDQNYLFDQYGEVKVTIPEYNGRIRPTKSATENEYVHNLPNFGTDVKKYCFDFTLEQNMINPFFKFYAINDTNEKFAMYDLTLLINGDRISSPSKQTNGLLLKDGVLAKGTTIQIYSGYFTPASGYENDAHVAKLIQLVD